VNPSPVVFPVHGLKPSKARLNSNEHNFASAADNHPTVVIVKLLPPGKTLHFHAPRIKPAEFNNT
jgi:hypothetical protein